MPTSRVQPGDSELLQAIANALTRAKKVVVVTGAGISTNSGIPDFRSENGLYKLIQDQYDATARAAASQAALPPPPPALKSATSDPGQASSRLEEFPEDRPKKRQKLSPPDKEDSGEQDSNTTGIEGPSSQPVSRESSLVPDSQPASRSEGRESPERDEIRCASTPPATRLETSTSLPATEGSQSSQEQSSILASSQGSTASARLPIPNIKGRDLFDASIWSCPIRTSVFYTFATTLRQKVRDVTPTSSHFFISHLRDRGKLVRCYTQNIDRIEEKVGLSTSLDQGPGQRSRFSTRRPPVLSRVNSGAPGASSADSAPSSSSASTPGGQGGGPTSSNVVKKKSLPKSESMVGKQIMDKVDQAQGCLEYLMALPPTDPAIAVQLHLRETGLIPLVQGLRNEVQELAGAQQRTEHPSSLPSRVTSETSRLRNAMATRQRMMWRLVQQPAQSIESSQTGLTTAPKPQRQSSSSGGVECVFLHGSLECLRCFLCRRVCEWEGDDREEQTLSGRQPECPHCAGATAAREERGKRALGVGKLRPDIVLYGEEHPSAHLISPIVTHDLGLGPDLLLILGTSLKVHGLKVLVRQFAKAVHSKGGKVVFVNFTKPPESSWGDVIDYWVEWDCDAWVGDLKEKAPVLWLPPGTEEPKKRKSIGGRGGAEKKIIGEKRKITPANAKKAGTKSKDEGTAGGSITVSSRVETITTTINVATGAPLESIVCTEETTVKVSAPEPSAHDLLWAGSREAYRENPPKQGRVGLRDDKANGAYSTWKIMESLRRISGRPAPPPMELPTVEISRAIGVAETKEAKREWKRKKRSSLALAREEAAAGQGSDTPPVKRGDTPHLQGVDDSPPAQATPNNPPAQSRMPEVWSIHSSGPPLTHGSTLPAVPNGGVVTSKKRKALPGLNMGTRMKQGRLGPLVDQAPLTSTPAKSDSQEQPLPNTSTLAMMDPRKREPFVHQQQTPSPFPAEQAPRPSTPPSILAAVKSNPRKRKRKMIDGEEVVLPTMGTRVKLPPPAPAGKENRDVAHHHSRQKIPSLVAAHNDADFSSITLAPLQQPMTPRGWQQKQKPEPMEPMSSPRGPASGFSGLSRMSVSGRLGDPFFYEDALIRVGSERRVVRDVRDERGAEGVVGVNRGVLSEREMAAARALTGMIR
ncbi:uncharacterized protein DNG_04204 [Cephalotrichum gorgonifer]|uniref:Deacetylase sirtuin-type domain-containing protein n=1 Tax=Cephalotrichum gorgonifer TaxID=2041049 RepID=A0AAE8SUY9_9PEZI|nr:uncharacterized protein DNG_04204 [Cephalotrichum gorgonifer]